MIKLVRFKNRVFTEIRGEFGDWHLELTIEEAQELADKINQMLMDYELEKKQRCNDCGSVFDDELTECPDCGRDDCLMEL